VAADVLVLMSTYCGREYIARQLESIFAQTYDGSIKVLVRDDGSKDDTASLIEQYPQKENRKIHLVRGGNVGPQRSFLQLIELADDAKYYFFADQDDVWDEDKIEIAINKMQPYSHEPVCYCSNYRLSDMDLQVYRESAIGQRPSFTPLRCIFYNQIPGCAMGFNRALMQLLKRLHLGNVMMHDSMTLALAAFCGKVIYDPRPRITHRIHKTNVVGDGHKKIVLRKWIAEKAKLLRNKENYDLSEMAEQFLIVAGAKAPKGYVADMTLLRDYKKSRKNTGRLLRHPDTQGSLKDRTALSIRSKIRFRLF